MSTASQSRDVASSAGRADIAIQGDPNGLIVQSLRHQVANAFVLYVNYKHYHWQAYGPLFRDLHLLFEELAQQVLGTIDDLAERVRMIGGDPPANLGQLADLASVTLASPRGTMRDMVDEAARNEMVVIREMRSAATVADEHNDPGSVDLFSRFVQIHEKQEWWLREILRKRDGLSG